MTTGNNISIGILTRHRLSDLRRCATSAMATVGIPANVIIAFDDDLSNFRACPNWHWAMKFPLPMRHYYVRGMNVLFALMKQYNPNLDYFVVTNDDSEFLTPGWGEEAISTLHERFPDGMGVLELAHPDLCAHYVSRRAVFDAHFEGNLAHPEYTMYFSDNHLRNSLKDMDMFASIEGSGGKQIINHYLSQDTLREDLRYWRQSDRKVYKKYVTQNNWHDKWINNVDGEV